MNSLKKTNEVCLINIDKYIKSMKIKYTHMIELIDINRKIIDYFWYTNSIIKNEKRLYLEALSRGINSIKSLAYILLTLIKVPLLIFRRLFQVIIRIVYEKKLQNYNIYSIIKKINNGEEAIYVFDQSYNSVYLKIVKKLKELGIISIAVPHGHNMMANELIWSDSFSIYPKDKQNMDKFVYDYVVFENNHIADRYKKLNIVDESQVKVIGSSRFSIEWVNYFRTIIPKDNRLEKFNKYFKILFFLSKPHYNGNPSEVIRTIKYMSLFKNTIIVLKPHTRGMRYKEKFSNNVIVLDNSYHSTNLIDWANLTVFTHTSVILDCLQMDKPALYLKNTHSNKLLSEQYFNSWQVECRDDLRMHLLRLLRDNQYRTYSKEDRDHFCNDCIEPPQTNVLQSYVDFILGDFSNH